MRAALGSPLEVSEIPVPTSSYIQNSEPFTKAEEFFEVSPTVVDALPKTSQPILKVGLRTFLIKSFNHLYVSNILSF